METKSITEIKDRRDEIKELIKSSDVKLYAGQTFGSENEYSYKSLIGGIEALLTDISTLLRSPSRFIKISTYSERSTLNTYLQNIKTYINDPGNLYAQVDQLKLLLRPYNLRFFEDRFIEFEKEIDEARKIKINLQEDKAEVVKIIESIKSDEETVAEKITSSKTSFEELEELILTLTEKKELLETEIEALEEKNKEILKIKEDATFLLATIKQSGTESSANEKLIKNFAISIQKSEANVTLLDSRLEENEKKLATYEEERKSILKEANSLIESSRQALNYSTTKGISESFDTQYNKSSSKWLTVSWLVGGLFFIISVLYIGFLILHSPVLTTNMLIGRLLMVPVLLVGLYFCISQYSKQKNIIEDYAYKKVISQAMVGFSEQLQKHQSENSDEYVTYMKTALGEIHKDPLRNRDIKEKDNSSNASTETSRVFDMFEKFVNLYKGSSQ